MSTYYIQGSMSPEQSIKFFELFFLSVQQLIALDNDFQMELERHFYDEDEDNADDYYNIAELKRLQNMLLNFLAKPNAEINPKDDSNIAKAYKDLIITYKKAYSNSYNKIISTMENDDVSEQEIEDFNVLLREISNELDKTLAQFYDVAEVFAAENDIELT